MQDIFSIPLKTLSGEQATLKQYQGKVLLLVNVASRCGFTSQYRQLETLYQRYRKQGLVLCGFPCNQFNQQEPGDSKTIQCFIRDKYAVSFPMFEKIKVKGRHRHPLYRSLEQQLPKKTWLPFIPWNFAKILVDRNGKVIKRFLPWTKISIIEKEVEQYIRQTA